MDVIQKYDITNWISSRKTRWLLHLVFWLAVLIFYTIFFGYKNVDYKITFSYVVVLLPVTIVTTYFLNYELIPHYLFKKRYGKFILYFIYTIIISFYIEMVTVIVIFITVAELNMSELHPTNTDAILLIAGMYVVVFLGVAVKLVNHYNRNQIQIQKLKKEKIEVELKFLKTQLHPHFLFNTLNNLYALTLEKSDKAPDVVLKISGLLDYILYECTAEFVPVEKEIMQIESYIELEKLRFGDRLDVNFSARETSLKTMIPPMLLMTLVENSFKHGVSNTIEKSWIHIELKSEQKTLLFSIENSNHKSIKSSSANSKGIGLQNLRNRLDLIYKANYTMNVEEDNSSYRVILRIKTIIES